MQAHKASRRRRWLGCVAAEPCMDQQDKSTLLKAELSSWVLQWPPEVGALAVRILLVEDDEMLGEAVRDGLRQIGHVVDWVQDGAAALAAVSTSMPSAVVLDLG